MLAILCLLASDCVLKTSEVYIHPCNRDWISKSLETKIELSIGCSQVNGRRVYRLDSLEYLYEKGVVKRD